MVNEKSGKRSVFIVLDGIDGSGKSTQALYLAEWLIKNGKKVVLFHEPNSKTAFGRKIKELLRGKKANGVSKKRWVAMFTKQRNQTLKEIKKALDSGKIVICDRYYYSTMAYQLGEKEWKSYAKKFLKPDIAFIFNLPLGEALKRINKKNEEQMMVPAVFERTATLREVKGMFIKIPKIFREAKLIDTSPGPNKIFSQIKKEVAKKL